MIKSKRVRQRFIDQIVKVSKRVLARTGVDEPRIIVTRPRIYIPIKEEFDLETLNSLLATVPGVVSFSYFKPIILDHDVLRENIILLGKRILKKGNSFAVRVSREGEHDFTSQELAAKLGGFILDEFNNIDLHVDLNNPDITFFVEVRHQNVAIYHDKYEGTGGIPKDISSPIIAITTPSDRSWLSVQELLKRGVKVFYLTYYDFINTSCDYDSRVAMLNKDDKIISKMFELFSFQDKNTIKVGILPISKKIREYCKKYGVDLDHISNQTILALISSFLLLKETYARDDAEHPRKRRFKGISCDWIYSNVEPYRQIASYAKLVDKLSLLLQEYATSVPLLLPLFFTEFEIMNDHEAQSIGLLDVLEKEENFQDFLHIIKGNIEGRMIFSFDMLEKCFN